MARLTQEDVQLIAVETYRLLLEQELQEVAKAHAEQLRLLQWIEEIAEHDELDISTLADEAEKRAYALAIKHAEDAVMLAEAGLAEFKRKILELQKRMAIHVGSDPSWGQVSMKALIAQEEIAAERLNAERKRLTDLKLSERGLTLIKS